jgi:hypothetical protein
VLVSCSKKERPEVDNEAQTVADEAIADQEFMGFLAPLCRHLSATSSAAGDKNLANNCKPLIYQSGDTLHPENGINYLLDISGSGGFLSDGKARTGQLFIKLTDKFKTDSSKIVLRTSGFVSDGWSYSCDSIVIYRLGTAGSHISFSYQLFRGKCSLDERTIVFNCKRNLSFFYGGGPLGALPYTSVYGDASGTNSRGLGYQIQIENDLVKPENCTFFTAGVARVIPSGFKDRLVNFGSGECDDQATFEVNENKVSFKLK